MLVRTDARSAIIELLKAFLKPVIAIPFLFLGAWVTGLGACGISLSIWNLGLAKDTTIWFVGTACILLVNANGMLDDADYLRTAALANMKLGAVLVFVLNLAVFPLIIELAIQPLAALAIGVSTVAARDPAQAGAKKLADWILGLIVLATFAYSVDDAVSQWHNTWTVGTAIEFVLPVWLTLGVLPYIYLFGLLCAYDRAWRLICWRIDNWSVRRRAILALARTMGPRVQLLGGVNGPWIYRLTDTATWAETLDVARSCRAARLSGTEREQ